MCTMQWIAEKQLILIKKEFNLQTKNTYYPIETIFVTPHCIEKCNARNINLNSIMNDIIDACSEYKAYEQVTIIHKNIVVILKPKIKTLYTAFELTSFFIPHYGKQFKTIHI